MADSNIGIERWQRLTGSNYSTGVSRWEELNQTKYTKDIINIHNAFTLATVPLGASRDDVFRTKYKDKSFNELNVILRGMDEGEEKNWLTQYANSPEVMTQKDYENAISIAENQRDWYRDYRRENADKYGTYTGDSPYAFELSKINEELERLYSGLYQREAQDKYGVLGENADYDRLSSQVSDEPTVSFGNFFRGTADATYDYINNIDGAREANRHMQQKAGGGSYGRYNKYDHMTAEEIANYNYLYQKEGRDAADEYLDYLSYDLDERQIESEKQRAAELATENPFMASAVSVPANLASGLGLVDVALQQAGRAISGNYRPINYNRGAMGANAFATGVREGVSQNLVDKYGQIGIDSQAHPVLAKMLNGKSWADVYNLGMSMADSGALVLTGFGPAASVLLGGAAGTQTMLEAVERGANDKQALAMGVLAGGFEALFEAIPLGKLEELIQGGAPNILRAMASQGLTEGLEELGTGIANNVADILIMAENSNYEKNIAAYIVESGLSPEEAKKQALLDMAIQLGWDFVGGAVSGGVFGAGGYTVNKINAAVENRSDKPTIAKDMELIQTAAETRLKELGETGDTGKLAKILAKNAAGKRLSEAEKERLSTSKYGTRVSNELNAANIESGEFASGWAENIGTEKIHAEQYSRGIEKAAEPDMQKAADEFVAKQLGENRNVPTDAPESSVDVAETAQTTEAKQAVKATVETGNDGGETQIATAPAELRNENMVRETDPRVAAAPRNDNVESAQVIEQAGATSEEAEDIEEQESTVHDADTALALVRDMGQTGADLLDYAKDGVASRYLTQAQIESAYRDGQRASDKAAEDKDNISSPNRGNGRVRGDGVTISDLDKMAKKNFNAPQRRAYRALSTFAEATGINIVLYDSRSEKATEEQRKNQGKFSDDTIYIDINAGLRLADGVDSVSKYAMLRTFGHEFVHFIEKHNAKEYNEFRRFVFDTLKQRGENVAELIESKRVAAGGKMSYDAASREVIAEAMTDILPDSNLMQELAEKHRNVFQTLIEKLKEFLQDIRGYFDSLAPNRSLEANALKEEIDGAVHYLEDIVKAYDKLALNAVEKFRGETLKAADTTVDTAKEEAKPEPKVSTSENGYTITDNTEYDSIDVKFSGKPSETIRNALKGNGFRWNGKRSVWYGKMSHEDATAILDKAYEQERAEIEEAEQGGAETEERIATAESRDDSEVLKPADDIPRKAETEEAKQEEKPREKPKTEKSAEKPKKPAKAKELVTDETVKLNDFGEKIGGARKDLWSSRGLEVSDLEEMNDRERDKHVKKDNVWKRPDYVKLAEGGAAKGLLYMQNEIRKSLPQNITYRRNETEESRRERQELFIQTVRQIEEMAKGVQTAAELETIGYAWGLENGYLEKTDSTYRPYSLTNKYYSNPALSGSDYFQTVARLVKNFGKLNTIAEKEGFAVDAKSKVPKGYRIVEDNKGTWFIAKGSFIIKSGIPSYDEALNMLKGAVENKKKKTRFVPQQLLEVHRRGPNYRHGDNVEGNDYIDTFGFKGGEFGNWMSTKDRQVSLNYGFDALKDLAFALGIADTDISFGGKLSIAFGARGQGLSGAAAHYEPDRQVINLTKMNGAGSLAHEWFHGLDDFMGGFKKKMGSDNVRSLPEKTQQAMRNLISTMQYRDETREETDLRATKLFEQAQKNLRRAVENQFPWVETLRAGNTEQVELLFPYYKRNPNNSDLAKFEAELNALIESGDMKHASNLSELRKEIQGHVIPKEDMNGIGFYATTVKNAGEGVQRGRVRTDFYNDSRRFGELHSKDGDYWDSTVEMAARAFACYVADRTGKNNDYLTGHAEAAFTLDADAKGNVRVIRAYPVGAERAAINEAFDELISAMKEDGYLHERVQEPTPEEVQYQAREYSGPTTPYKKISQQEYRQIQEDRMTKYGDMFDEMPNIDYIYAHNKLYVIENLDETQFGVIDRIDPSTNKANIALEVFNEGPVRDIQDYRGRTARLRSFQKLRSMYHSSTRNRGTGTGNAGLDIGSGGSSNGAGVLARGSNDNEGNAQYQPRIESLSDREVLQLASKELEEQKLSMNEAERDALRISNERLTKLQELEAERKEAGTLYRQQQFGPGVDREAAKATLERMHELDEKILKAEMALVRAEDADTVKRIVQRARKITETKDRAEMREAIKRMNDRRDNAAAIKKYRERIRADVNTMSNWVTHPNNKDVLKHVPDVLKSSVVPFITSIDFTSKRQLGGGAATKADEAFVKRLEAVKKALNTNADINGLYSGYSDLPPNFNERLEQFIEDAKAIAKSGSGEYIINRMSSEELKALSEIVRNLKKLVTNFNLFHANAMYQHVYESGDNSIEYMGSMKNAGMTNNATNFVMWQNMRPAYAFERFGKGGEAIYDGLRRGQAQLAFNTKKIVEFAEKAYTEKEVNDWAKEIKTFTIDGEKVTIPVSYIMGLYELSKRPQALTHILGDGIRIATFKKGTSKISDTGHVISQKELETIVSSLTPRQKAVADALQKYMAEQGGKWGNYVSVKRWGEEMFGEEHYYPINSDGRHLSANAEESPSAASLYSLLNMSFTKELQEGANNRIIIYDIFDVFSNHMASMAQYNALALPVLDAVKWFNYQQKNENGKVTGSVREQMDRVYGVPEENKPGSGKKGYAQGFVENIIRAFNGTEAQGVPTDEVGLKSLRRYNMAQVATNVRVIIQQPLAIARAALLVDYDSIIKGMKPQQAKQNIEEMRKHSGIAAWKELGFYDVNISRGVTSLIKHDTDWRDTVNEYGMKGAEFADTLTWAGIWSACKEQVKKSKRLKPGDKGFYEAVTELFEDVIYKTQVVDSVLTKSEYSRSKGFFTRATASFMSEPTTTASMLLSALDKYTRDIQKGKSRAQAWKENRGYIGRVAYVYGVGGVLLAAVQAVADAFRDDDEYQNFWEKWGEAFIGNVIDELAPFNKLPIISDFYDLAKELLSIMGVNTYGNPPQSVFMQWYDSLVKGTEIIWDKINGKDTDYTWYGGIYKLLQAVSGMVGLPMAATTREVVTAWNTVAGGVFSPSLRVKTYEPSETAQIKYAYRDGWLTAEEATDELIKQGLADNENEAYFLIQKWESGDDNYSRYDAIYEAVRNGGDFKGAMKELTDHGYTEKDVISQVKSQIGTWYKEREISKQQAINMLTKYVGIDSEEITKTVNEWSAKVVTGIAYDDIKDEYLSGNITATRAAEMYVRYGGMSKEDAAWRIKIYDWQEAGFDIDTSNKSIVINYETYCQPAGIDRNTYYEAYLFYKDSGETDVAYSKTRETMPYINSLPLTAEQKTALALCWWSKSTVNKYKLW